MDPSGKGGSAYGGYSSGTGDVIGNKVVMTSPTGFSTLVARNLIGGTGNARGNTVTVTGGTINGSITGGQSTAGDASENSVTVTGGTINGPITGGDTQSSNASGNIVDLGAINVTGGVYGGSSMMGDAKNNTIHLRGARVTNTVCGGQAPTGESEGNTLDVHSYPGGSFINDFDAIQNLHFHVDNDAVSPVNPMLQLGIFAKDIRGLGIGVGISGGAKLLEIGETIRLLQTGGGSTKIGRASCRERV